MSETRPSVIHDEDGQRFFIAANGATAELAYRTAGNQIIFMHTGVPAELEGRGIGSALAKAGLEYAREHGMEVIPLCPFVRGYIERKPEYQALVRRSSGGFA
jgi:predicted GNAT family acetyltransferase